MEQGFDSAQGYTPNRRTRRTIQALQRRARRRGNRRIHRQLRAARVADGARPFDIEDDTMVLAGLVEHGMISQEEADRQAEILGLKEPTDVDA